MNTQRTTPETYSFAVYPADMDAETFEPFIMDVPTLSGEPAAARRAWWSAFHLLGSRGFEPEAFTVCAWRDDAPGPLVTAGGFVIAEAI